MKVTLVGYGNVGTALAVGLARAGHQVALAARADRPQGATAVREAHPELATATVAPAAEAVTGADVVVLAVPFPTLDDVLPGLADRLAGTVVVDATNPVGPGLTHGLRSERAGAQQVAALLPGSRVVKAFSIYGFENLTSPPQGPDGVRPVMLLAGDDAGALATVGGLAADLGWEPVVAGGLAAALDLEHLTLLWIRLVRGQGLPPRLVWAALREPAGATPGS